MHLKNSSRYTVWSNCGASAHCSRASCDNGASASMRWRSFCVDVGEEGSRYAWEYGSLVHRAAAWFMNQSEWTQMPKANVVEVQCCCRRSRCENDASTKWCCTLFHLLLTRWHFAQRYPSLLQSLRGARSGGTYCQRMKHVMAKQDMALENALIVAPTEVPLLGVVPLLRLQWPRLQGPWQWIVAEFGCRSSFGNVLFLGRCPHLALIDRASALRSLKGVRCGAAGLWFRSGPVHSAWAFLLKLIS